MIKLDINGKSVEVDADSKTPLLWVLREWVGLTGTKYGCGVAQCGACTVLVNGAVRRSCVTPVGSLEDNEVVTLEGLGTLEKPHPLQTAWIEEQVNQCGYCINGWIMEGAALLKRNPKPTEAQVRDAFSDLICRCGTHNAAVRAVLRASKQA